MKKIFFLIALLSVLTNVTGFAQDDLEKVLAQQEAKQPAKEYVMATFKTTRLINFHTLETVGRRTLDFRISHRFGDINSGVTNFFGLDGPANIRFSLEYSFDGRFMFGLGRTSADKLYDGFLKYRLIRQTTNDKVPVSVTLFTSANYTGVKDNGKALTGFDKYEKLGYRYSYASELIVGRKFSSKVSLQLQGFYIHYNLVDKLTDKNDMFAVGIAGRVKMTKRMSISGEYAYRLNKYTANDAGLYNSAGIGIDIETGGHVFQMHFTNSFGLNEVQYIPYTNTSWKNFGVRLGFNISRVFTL